MWLASVNGDAAIIEALIKGGADPNEKHPLGRTPLMEASRTGNVDAMKVLLDHGADVNAKETLRGTTPLMWAADEGHAPAIKLLIERGADIKAQLESGRAWTRAGARKIERSQKAGRGARRGARCRTSIAALGRRSCCRCRRAGAVAVAVAAGVVAAVAAQAAAGAAAPGANGTDQAADFTDDAAAAAFGFGGAATSQP